MGWIPDRPGFSFVAAPQKELKNSHTGWGRAGWGGGCGARGGGKRGEVERWGGWKGEGREDGGKLVPGGGGTGWRDFAKSPDFKYLSSQPPPKCLT